MSANAQRPAQPGTPGMVKSVDFPSVKVTEHTLFLFPSHSFDATHVEDRVWESTLDVGYSSQPQK